jgi:cytochrome d ubiquinol oxidase subunit I
MPVPADRVTSRPVVDPGPLVFAVAETVVDTLPGGPQPDALEARRMQALSLAVHIPIVCMGIAFPAIILFVEGLYLRTHDPTYKALAKRWSKVALIIFAVGVITGTILSFELGLLWPEFMATFGEVFGVAFGLEGISFFLEAIFIAIYVYGWGRLPDRAHFLTGVPIVITGFTGSFTVIAVNGWMNNPQGFDVVDGRVVSPRPWEALINDNLWHELVHMYVAGYIVAGFLVAGVYARAWLKGRRDRYHRTGLVVALSVAALAAPVQVIVGDWAGRQVAETQPVKLAGFEGLTETQEGAPFTIGGFYDEDRGEVRYGIEIPKLLSLLAHHDPNARVVGLDSVPPRDRPPVNIVRIAFQTMIAIGTGMALLGVIFFATWLRKRRLPESRLFYWAVVAAGPASVVALIAGWVTTEVGRQPWIVYEVMRTSQAVTAADDLEIGFAFLVIVYLSLAVAVVWLLRRLAAQPPHVEIDEPAARYEPRSPTAAS